MSKYLKMKCQENVRYIYDLHLYIDSLQNILSQQEYEKFVAIDQIINKSI